MTEEIDKKNITAENIVNDVNIFSHKDLLEITRTALNDLIKNDSLLGDLPADMSVDEVKAQLALEHGQSMRVYVLRGDGEELPVVVKHKNSTVLDLKRAIRRHMSWRMERKKQRVKISWKYIWKTYDLQFENHRLTRDAMLLSELGIRNKSVVTFVKRLRAKGAPTQKDDNN